MQQRHRGGLRVGSAAADRGDALVGFDHVAGAAEHQQMFRVADQQQRFEPAQRAVLAPVLGELDGGAHQVAARRVELALEFLEQRDAVGGAAGEARDHGAAGDPAHLAGAVFHDGLVEGDLSVAGHRDLTVAKDRDDRGRSNAHPIPLLRRNRRSCSTVRCGCRYG